MPQMRKSAKLGNVIIGMAGSGRDGLRRLHPQLIYWMQVDEILGFDQYWNDPRFARKKPQIPGPKSRMVGDNTYRRDPGIDDWAFETSMHYVPGALQRNGGHVQADTSVDRILLSRRFTYWGASGPAVPNHLIGMFPKARGFKCNHPDPELVLELHELIGLASPGGLNGEPADWDNSRYFPRG